MNSSARCVPPQALFILAVLISLLFSQHPELLLLLQHHLSPLLLRTLSERSAFPLTLRGTRVVFLLLKQFSAELTTEAEVFLTLLIKLVSGEADAGETRPGWMRVLAMEIMRGCVFLLSLSLIIRRLYTHTRVGSAGTLSSCVASGNATML
jgi:hypothetical protein